MHLRSLLHRLPLLSQRQRALILPPKSSTSFSTSAPAATAHQTALPSDITEELEVDYLILGAGSAGSVLASRLTEDEGVSVGVIEAGPRDVNRLDSWTVQMPAALTYSISDDRFNWNYATSRQ